MLKFKASILFKVNMIFKVTAILKVPTDFNPALAFTDFVNNPRKFINHVLARNALFLW